MTDQKMILSKNQSPCDLMGYYVAPYIYSMLLKASDKVHRANQDRVYIITGREGLGKSTLAIQLAYVVDQTFCVDRIVFSSDEFERVVRTAPLYSAIIFDECFNGLSSKGSLSQENKRLVRLLMECRQRNLFIFLVLPSFFLLEKYPALFRSQALFNVMVSKRNIKLRYYKVYNYEKKQQLYIYGKALMSYSKPKIVLKHRFHSKLPKNFDLKVYLKRKHESFVGFDEENVLDHKHVRQRNALFHYLYNVHKVSATELHKVLNDYGVKLNRVSISEAIRGVKLELKSEGSPPIFKKPKVGVDEKK